MNIKSTCFFIISALLFTSAAFAAPKGVVERPVFDFGTVSQGKKVDHVFILRNTGDRPLAVNQVTTSCGCTVADVSSRNILPGKISEIKVTFNSENFAGNISKIIHINTNDPKTPVYNLTVKGTVVEEIELVPRQLNLGTLSAGTSKEMLVKIVNRGKQSLSLTSVRSSMPQMTAQIKKKNAKPGEEATVLVTVVPKKEDSFLGGYLNIATTSSVKPEITMPVYASVRK